MDNLLLGVDLGTMGTRTGLFTSAGVPLAEASAATPLRWHGPSHVDQNPDDFYGAALRTIAECMERSGADPARVAALGIAGQMAGVLGVDEAGRPSMPYDSWLDTRCSPDVAFLDRELGAELVARTGCPPMVDHAPKLRWWRREHPDAFARTAKLQMPGGYVAGRLAGLAPDDAFIDRTYLHFTGLAEARLGVWSETLTRAMGVPARMLPRIVEPATVIGRLTPEAASQCGLRAGIPIAAGLGDTAAGALGTGIVRPNQLLDTAGTAAVFAASTAAFRPDEQTRTLIVMRGALEGQWIALAYLSGGDLLAWFETALGSNGQDDANAMVDFERLSARLAGIAAGSDGLLFIPHLDGRVLPSDPAMRGAWVGLQRRHTREHLGHAILEGVAYEYAGYLRVLRTLYPELAPHEARVAGGGARSALWNRIKATVLGVPYVRLDREEFSCWGAALVAGHAVGLFNDLADAATAAVAVRERVEPDPREHEVYERMSEQYRAVVELLAAPSRALAAIANGEEGVR